MTLKDNAEKEIGRYEIVSGNKRTHAAIKAGLVKIPAITEETK